MTKRAMPTSRRLIIDIDDPTDPEARAAVLAVIAIRLARFSADSDVPALPTADLIYAAARHARYSLQLSEKHIVELLTSASEIAARLAFHDASHTDAAASRPFDPRH
ncbi:MULTISPECIES: hypothetical protein [unclassified Paracoccus (in: a-proteobacteria)]|uniref:hypothetical protein n=1 Tax=unclassified Paracoccus (in: a-proteobacteria) TaxID=2688777 RepID=UPI0012B3C744|nr:MULTISPECIES: hypothetical protein [unclassified Paracoccus (in: a-proteobacteria)]UXU75525.1 hypothetical protein GB879_003260 [Paracoccus sp. SMMA_5]UXU81430.1 hypothetical protein GB880_003255 [Paracoccus sp. SMMA_5_TC]